MTDSTYAPWAHWWAQLGLWVFPCKPDKSPYTPHGFKDASRDPDVIEQWWAEHPDAGIGVDCGRSQLVVVDLDVKSGKDGVAEWTRITEGVDLPDTFRVTTPSGGEHYWFRDPGGKYRSSADQVAPGVDVRAVGGYVLIPPSPGYASVNGMPTTIDDVAEIPEGILPEAGQQGSAGPWKPLDRDEMDPRDLAVLEALETLGGHDPYVSGSSVQVTRPGKTAGASASIGHVGPGQVKIWTSGWPPLVALKVYDVDELQTLVADQAQAPQDQPLAAQMPTLSGTYFNEKGVFLPATLAADVMRLGPLALGVDDIFWAYRPEGVWRPDKNVVRNRVAQLIGEKYIKARSGNVDDIVRSWLDHQPISCDPVPEYINFRNGLLDWKTGELYGHTPDVPSTVQVSVDYDPDAECPKFDRFIAEVVPEDEVEVVWELLGYLMYSGNPFHKAVMLTGHGRNGKGTFLQVVLALLGRRNCTTITLHDLIDNRFAKANLFGKIANIAGDIDAGYLENTAMFKAITGGDQIAAEHKHRDQFEYTPWAVPIFSANKIPPSADTTVGYISRWLVVPFPNDFTGREDHTLVAKLTDPDEIRGVAAKALTRLPGLMERGAFTESESGSAAKDDFARRVDQVRTWVHECCDIADDHPWQPRTPLYSAYKMWAARDGYRPVRASEFYDRIEGAGAVPAKIHGQRGFTGIMMVDDGTSDSPPPPAPNSAPAPKHDLTSDDDESGGRGADRLSLTPIRDAREYKEVGVERPPAPKTVVVTPPAPVVVPDPSVAVPDFAPFDLETADGSTLHTYGPGFVRLAGYVADDAGTVGLTTDIDALATGLSEAGLVTAHNGMDFDLVALARYHGLDLWSMVERGAVADTLLMARQLDPPPARAKGRKTRRYDLDALGERFGLGTKAGDLKAMARAHGGYDQIPTDDENYRTYLTRDVELQAGVHRHLDAQLTDADRTYLHREHKVAALAAQLGLNGFRVDVDLLAERVAAGDARKAETLERIAADYDVPLTNDKGHRMKSPLATDAGKAALETAFTEMGVLPDHLPRTAKTGKLQTTGEAMTDLALSYAGTPIADPVNLLCSLVAQVTGERTIYHTISAHTHNGRVNPRVSMDQSTGRWSITSPGLTVIGKRGGRHVEREVLLADEGEVLVTVDYSQVDARAVAVLSGDLAYQAMFAPGLDLHTEIAVRVWGDEKRREDAKPLGHGWNYGMGVARLAEHTGLGLDAAETFDRAMRDQFPRLVEWKAEIAAEARTGALLDNGFGRKMRPDPDRAHTQGPAFMGQGAARDLMMHGLLNLPREYHKYLRAVVHDEVVMSVPVADAEEIERELVRLMTFPWGDVMIVADAGKRSENWGGCYSH